MDEVTTITVTFKSPSLDLSQLIDWVDSTFELLDMGDITYEYNGKTNS